MPTTAFTASPLDPYVIAEIGMNYEGSMERAKAMISSVARAGGHAAKFQTYKAETLASKGHSPAYWDTSKEATPSQYELFQKFDAFGPEEYAELATHCASVGVDFMSTPFDLDAVDFLEPLVPQFKVASADLTNVPLLRKIAKTGKPVLMSTGGSTLLEISIALDTLESAGATGIGLLHCVLRYPTPIEVANLATITTLREQFGHRATIGYSDHVPPNEHGDVPALDLACAFGATVLEKHFTDDRTATGNDHYHAFDEAGLRIFTERRTLYRTLAGSGEPDMSTQASARLNARRRIMFARDVAAGSILRDEDLIPLRADIGLEVSRWDEVIGHTLGVDRAEGDALVLEDLR